MAFNWREASVPVFDMLRAMAVTWGVIGVVFWWADASPLGWWQLKPRTKDEVELGKKYYERHIPPYPGNKEEYEAWVQRAANSRYGKLAPHGPELEQPAVERRVLEHDDVVAKEAYKLWLRMRREAARELEKQGYSVE